MFPFSILCVCIGVLVFIPVTDLQHNCDFFRWHSSKILASTVLVSKPCTLCNSSTSVLHFRKILGNITGNVSLCAVEKQLNEL